MSTSDFKLIIETERSAQDVFQAVLNVRQWWTGYFEEEFEGAYERPGDEFSFKAGQGVHQCTIKITELIPHQKLVWLVTSSKLTFIETTDEWTGSTVIFDIEQKGNKTKLTFTHQGLTPEKECYTSCAPAWTTYLEHKLAPLINNERNNPTQK